MKKTSLFSVIVACLLVAGCTNNAENSSPDAAPTQTPEATPSAPSVPIEEMESEAPEEPEHQKPTPSTPPEAESDLVHTTPTFNERGNIVKEVGEAGGIATPDLQDMAVELWAHEIVSDFTCTDAYADPSENGKFVGIRFEVHIHPRFTELEIGNSYSVSNFNFLAFNADGRRANDILGTSSWCLKSSEELPYDLGPGQKAEGWIALDVPTDTTSVVLTFDPFESTGWEWELP